MSASTRIAEFWHLLRARMALLAGRREKARTSLKNALRKNPGSFAARFLLGRLYLKDGAVFKMKREFDLAWQVDPERFERCYARLRGQGDGVPDLFAFEMRSDGGVRVSTRRRERRIGFARGSEEQHRLAALPPIGRDDIKTIDWDRFETDIFDDSEL